MKKSIFLVLVFSLLSISCIRAEEKKDEDSEARQAIQTLDSHLLKLGKDKGIKEFSAEYILDVSKYKIDRAIHMDLTWKPGSKTEIKIEKQTERDEMEKKDKDGKIQSFIRDYMDVALEGMNFSKLLEGFTLTKKNFKKAGKNWVEITGIKGAEKTVITHEAEAWNNRKTMDIFVDSFNGTEFQGRMILSHDAPKDEKWKLREVKFEDMRGEFLEDCRKLSLNYDKNEKGIEYIDKFMVHLEVPNGGKTYKTWARFEINKNEKITIEK